MEHFIARYRAFVTAVLSGFDRLVFRGTLLPLVIQEGMLTSDACGSATSRFQKVCRLISERVKEASLRRALEQARGGHF